MKKYFLLFTLSLVFDYSYAQQELFSLNSVKLLESPFKHAQDLNKAYLLSLNPDRLLAPFYKEADLRPKASNYGNWENTGLDGHTAGHYLSALAEMYAATGDPQINARLDYMLEELFICQIASGKGFLSGVPDGHRIFEEVRVGNIRANSFGLNDAWVPLYNIHKTFAGLKDAYVLASKPTARTMFLNLSEWFYNVTSNLSDQQISQLLTSEHGGLNESFVYAYQLSGEEKFLTLAKKLSHKTLLLPLVRQQDQLTYMHANTQIPKVIGFAKIGIVSGDKSYLNAATYFWNTVTQNRTVAIGGNSVREHFHPTDDFSSMISSEQGPENCNTYNMLRLTKELFENENDPKYLNYYERALYNNILSSQDPETGGFVYFTPMRPNHYRVYSSAQEDFWCCVGSGMENPGKYGEMIYAHDGDNLYVNLFIPSRVSWLSQRVALSQENNFPHTDFTTLTVHSNSPNTFSIHVRIPEWINGKMEIKVNNEPAAYGISPEGYAVIRRAWRGDDKITIHLPKKLTAEKLPDSSNWVAFFDGPIVLAAPSAPMPNDRFYGDGSRMGHVASGTLIPVSDAPVIVSNDLSTQTAVQHLHALNGNETFRLSGLNTPDKTLVPFFEIHKQRYQIYWQIATPDQLEQQQQAMRRMEEKNAALDAVTVDVVKTGEQQPESDHFFKDRGSYNGYATNSFYRAAWSGFSYVMRSKGASYLLVSLEDFIADRSFEVLIDNKRVLTETFTPTFNEKSKYFLVKLPKEFKKKSTVEVSINALNKKDTPAITSIRLLSKPVGIN